MTENEFLLMDRITKIKSTIEKYGEDKFNISFSGGKDSTVLSALVDLAIPGNRIPRVYADTGIELNMIRDFVYELKESDDRIQIIKPAQSIKRVLETYGYPFKSKKHSKKVGTYQRHGMTATAMHYLNPPNEKTFPCPKILRYQFTPEFKMKVDYTCCVHMKEKPLRNWAKDNNRPISMIGIMKSEEGARAHGKCMAFSKGKLKAFQPLIPVSKEWEDWFIEAFNVKICDIYKPPYNLTRTGCKGCPFSVHLQEELDMIERYFPNERKQCEIIWKPVYDEYRRLGYRLKDGEKHDT